MPKKATEKETARILRDLHKTKGKRVKVQLSQIQPSQYRANGEREEDIEELKDLYLQKIKIDLILVALINGVLICIDGHHRLKAMILAGITEAWVILLPGDETDALLYALQSNREVKVKLTPADKRAIIRKVLLNPECCRLSDTCIAKMRGVSAPFVSSIRKDMEEECSIPRHETFTTIRAGKWIESKRRQTKPDASTPRTRRKKATASIPESTTVDATTETTEHTASVYPEPALMQAPSAPECVIEAPIRTPVVAHPAASSDAAENCNALTTTSNESAAITVAAEVVEGRTTVQQCAGHPVVRSRAVQPRHLIGKGDPFTKRPAAGSQMRSPNHGKPTGNARSGACTPSIFEGTPFGEFLKRLRDQLHSFFR